MLEILGKKTIVVSSLALTVVMLLIVMLVLNPHIDGTDGLSVIKLQIAFHKAAGIAIISNWGGSGIAHFNQWIFSDYIYAFSYSLFLASLLSLLLLKQGKGNSIAESWVIYLPFIAGTFDAIENTLEWVFINDPENFSTVLFFFHSIIATLKWSFVLIAITYSVVLAMKNKKTGAAGP